MPVWRRTAEASRSYDGCVVPYLLGPWATDLLEAVTPGSEGRLLDIACGTGAVARLAADRFGARVRVIGVDIHREMLTVAAGVAGEAGLPIAWTRGDATRLPFRDASFDVAVCQQGLQFFPDRAAALEQMHRVLAPGGCVRILVWGPITNNPYFRALCDAVERHLGSDMAQTMRSAFALSNSDEVRALLESARFKMVSTRLLKKPLPLPPLPEFIPRHLASSSLAEPAAAMPDDDRAMLVEEVISALPPHRRTDGLTVPFETILAVGAA